MNNTIDNKPKVRTYIPSYIDISQINDKPKIKVAAYARVSTDKEEQEDSFERQVEYYTRYIQNKSEWDFVGIYADPGITGTRADKRPEFQRMMEDCRKGLIQKIMCKSIARFARNTVDALKYIRELKELGIGVYFETQNIDTSTQGGDVLLIILAGIAEEESRSISKNVKWAMQKKFQQGDFMLNYTRFLGYTRDEEHNLVIVPEEAEIVKRIFREYQHGYGYAAIAKHLQEDKIKTCTGKEKWEPTVIQRMLKNEKYCGSVIMGKTYKIDVLSKKRVKSDGKNSQMYYAEDCIPPIIDKETFTLVQQEMKRRAEVKGCSESNNGRFSSKYAFSKKIVCGECGTYYRRHAQVIKGEYKATWVCPTHKLKPNECHQCYIQEEYIKESFLKTLKSLVGDMDKIKKELLNKVANLLDRSPADKTEEIKNEIETYQSKMMEIYKRKTRGEISTEDYNKQATDIATQINSLKVEQEKLQTAQGLALINKRRMEEIEEYLKSINPTTEFNDEIFTSLVDQVVVRNRYELEFQFKIGLKKTYKPE